MSSAPSGTSDALLQTALLRNRERLNARFAQARVLHPGLDGNVFQGLIRSLFPPILEALSQTTLEERDRVLYALYELSLELMEKELLGTPDKYPAIYAGWKTLLPTLGRLLLEDPRRAAGAITNALYQLSHHKSLTVQCLAQLPAPLPSPSLAWIERVHRAIPLISNLNQLLKVGRIAAWRVGMAQFRRAALDLIPETSPEVLQILLDLPHVPRAHELVPWVALMQKLPWISPSQLLENIIQMSSPDELLSRYQTPRRLLTCGGFTGFGGPFRAPPKVSTSDQNFLIEEGEDRAFLFADCFGCTLIRLPEDFVMGPPARTTLFSLQADGVVQVLTGRPGAADGSLTRMAALRGASSYASTEQTLVVSHAHSHLLQVVGLSAVGSDVGGTRGESG